MILAVLMIEYINFEDYLVGSLSLENRENFEWSVEIWCYTVVHHDELSLWWKDF